MNVRFRSAVVLVAVVGVVTGGCTGSNPGSPSPTSGPSSASSSRGLPGPGVPKVGNPLNAEKFLADPCSVITKAQAAEVAGLTRSEADLAGVAGPRCEWSDSSRNDVAFAFIVAGGGGLTGVYENSRMGSAYFEPIEVAGYPAVFADVIEQRAEGLCSLAVGVRDDLLLNITSGFDSASPYYANSCPPVKKAAELALATMKGGA